MKPLADIKKDREKRTDRPMTRIPSYPPLPPVEPVELEADRQPVHAVEAATTSAPVDVIEELSRALAKGEITGAL
jgi:hypothetical protein